MLPVQPILRVVLLRGPPLQAVARHAIGYGHHVTLSNSRGPASLEALVRELGPLTSAGTRQEAARAEIVLLAVGRPDVPAAVEGLPEWNGRIVIDATNHFASLSPRPEIADLGDLGDLTGSEYVASLVPGARVVKAFNTLFGRLHRLRPPPRSRRTTAVPGR